MIANVVRIVAAVEGGDQRSVDSALALAGRGRNAAVLGAPALHRLEVDAAAERAARLLRALVAGQTLPALALDAGELGRLLLGQLPVLGDGAAARLLVHRARLHVDDRRDHLDQGDLLRHVPRPRPLGPARDRLRPALRLAALRVASRARRYRAEMNCDRKTRN